MDKGGTGMRSKEVVNQELFKHITNSFNDILRAQNILRDTVMYNPEFKNSIQKEMEDNFKNISKLVKNIEDRNNVAQQIKFTKIELKSRNIIE